MKNISQQIGIGIAVVTAILLFVWLVQWQLKDTPEEAAAKQAAAEQAAKAASSKTDRQPPTTTASRISFLIPSNGIRSVRVEEGSGVCDPQDKVQVTSSIGESFEDGPHLVVRRGKVPVGTIEEYRSLTGGPVEVVCFNRSLVK